MKLNQVLRTQTPLVLALALSFIWRECVAQTTAFTYQGRVLDDGTNFIGTGQFKFALVTSTNAGSQAVATAIMGGSSPYEFVEGFTIVSGGSGYTTPPSVTVSAPGGSGSTASATAAISGERVTAINVISPGSGYSSTPAVTIDPPPQTIIYATYWSNDGTSVAGGEPSRAVSVPVKDGLFTVVLGDTSAANMTAINAGVFLQPNLKLRIWFSDGVNGSAPLNPPQGLTATPYAAFANTASNFTGTLPPSALSGTYPGVVSLNNASDSFNGNGSGLYSLNASALASGTVPQAALGNAWKIGGNSGTTAGVNFLGTTDNRAVELHVNSTRALRLEPSATSPNLIGGYSGDSVGGGAVGATVAGGGQSGSPNVASGSFAFVGGGYGNTASGLRSFIGGGQLNVAAAGTDVIGGGSGNFIGAFVSQGNATIGGGGGNTNIGYGATIAGGIYNTVGSPVSANGYEAIGGGELNTAIASDSVIGGGKTNYAGGMFSFIGSGSNNVTWGQSAAIAGGERNYAAFECSVGGGYQNSASGNYAAVGGGEFNSASGSYSFIGGGSNNTATAGYSAIGGGFANNASGNYSVVGGGKSNRAMGDNSSIGGGLDNLANGSYSAIGGGNINYGLGYCSYVGGGNFNYASADYSLVGGGYDNHGSGTNSTVGGGAGNSAGGNYSTVSGGWVNEAYTNHDTVSGGWGNVASGPDATVGGGFENVASNWDATVGGGFGNFAGNNDATIGGGSGNIATGDSATIAGGFNNTNTAFFGVIGGGAGNTVYGDEGTIGGGIDNIAGASATVAGGTQNYASGIFATVPGGYLNVASGRLSLAAGNQASAIHQGAFVWGDSTAGNIYSTAPNQFTVRASGGTRFFSNSGATTGVSLAPGGGPWSTLSDRNAKENLTPANGRQILDRVAALPIAVWNYKSQEPTVRHIGPMAQDFAAAFGVGEDDKHITTVDESGVALAAVQGLNQKLEEAVKAKDAQIQALEKDLAELKAIVERLAAHGNGGAQ